MQFPCLFSCWHSQLGIESNYHLDIEWGKLKTEMKKNPYMHSANAQRIEFIKYVHSLGTDQKMRRTTFHIHAHRYIDYYYCANVVRVCVWSTFHRKKRSLFSHLCDSNAKCIQEIVYTHTHTPDVIRTYFTRRKISRFSIENR